MLRRPSQIRISVARRRAQPAVASIIRLTVTAIIAFELARVLTGVSAPILAPLTALLVVQVTLFHTLRTALQRVASVILGVVVALALSAWLGFSWWSLGVAIAAALSVGYVLRLGDSVLEVPISAMLILSLPTEPNVSGRLLATLIGAATGLISNLVIAPLRIQPAEEAVDDLGTRLADLLDQMAADLAGGHGLDRRQNWVARSRQITDEVETVEDALGEAEESVKLNPRSVLVIDPRVFLRRRLEKLEYASITVRGIARSLNDSAGLDQEVNPVRDQPAASSVADVLRELAAALRSYGQLARSKSVDRSALKDSVDLHLAEAGERQQTVANVMRADPAAASTGWPVRGELVAHLDRLRTELYPAPARTPAPAAIARNERWRRPLRAVTNLWKGRKNR
jgi:uncharacterized membrane protein YgaE (UPF0421/DUF939 family)